MRARSLAYKGSATLSATREPRTGAADLPLIEPDRVDQALDGAVQIRVLEHDERRLAAEFERQLLACAGGRLANCPSDFGRASEGDLVYARMRDQGGAGRPVAGDDVDDARGESRLGADRREGKRSKRREFRRLQHQSIAGCERRGDLPGQHKQRKIPRNDLPAHPDRLGPRKLTVDQRGPTGMMIEMAGDQRNVDIARLADRLAIVDRFQNRQETLALLHMARERIKMLRPLEAGERRPFGLSLPRRGDRCVDVGRRALRRAGDAFAGRGIEDLEQVAGLGEDAVDEMPEAGLVLFEPNSDMLAAFRGRTVVHRAQDVLDDAHRSLKPSRGGGRPNSARSHNGRADARCR